MRWLFLRLRDLDFISTNESSEISYRITDVECIKRAQTTQLKLTGMVGGF